MRHNPLQVNLFLHKKLRKRLIKPHRQHIGSHQHLFRLNQIRRINGRPALAYPHKCALTKQAQGIHHLRSASRRPRRLNGQVRAPAACQIRTAAATSLSVASITASAPSSRQARPNRSATTSTPITRTPRASAPRGTQSPTGPNPKTTRLCSADAPNFRNPKTPWLHSMPSSRRLKKESASDSGRQLASGASTYSAEEPYPAAELSHTLRAELPVARATIMTVSTANPVVHAHAVTRPHCRHARPTSPTTPAGSCPTARPTRPTNRAAEP